MKTQMARVFEYELRRNIRRKGYLFATFGIPLLLIAALLGYQFVSRLAADNDRDGALVSALDLDGIHRAGYVDRSGLFPQAGRLAEFLVPYADEAAAQAALTAGEIDVYYVIDEDYLATGDVTLTIPKFSFNLVNDVLIAQLAFETLVTERLAPGSDSNLLSRLRNPAIFERVTIGRDVPEGVVENEDASFLLVYVFAAALLVSTLMTNGYLMQSVIEEKESRLVEILLSSVRPVELLAGKIVAMGALGLLQVMTWLGAFLLALELAEVLDVALGVVRNLYVPVGDLPLILLYFVLAYLFLAAAFGTVGALSSSMREGPQMTAIFTLPMVAPLWALSLFVEAPDGAVPTALSMIPITAPLAMVMRLVLATVPAWQVAISVGVMMLAVLAMLWLAGRLFRVQTLLAGQRPKLRDVPGLLRG